MATQGGAVKALAAETEPDQFLGQTVQSVVPETMGRDRLKVIVHPLGVVDGAVSEGGGDRVETAVLDFESLQKHRGTFPAHLDADRYEIVD